MTFQVPRPRRRRARALAPAALAVVSTLLALTAAELVLRARYVRVAPLAATYPMGLRQIGRTLELRQLEYETTITYNRFGFRDADVVAAPVPDRRTILFLGDSFVEGFGVSEQARFGDLVGEALGADWRDVNAGQLVSQPISYYRNLRDFGLALEPDWVVVSVFMGNDFIDARHAPAPGDDDAVEDPAARFAETIVPFPYLRAVIARALGQRAQLAARGAAEPFWSFYFGQPVSRAFLLQRSGLDEADFDRLTADMDPAFVAASTDGRANPFFLLEALRLKRRSAPALDDAYVEADFQHVVTVIARMARLCAAHGARFLVVVIPDVYDVHRGAYRRFLEETLDLDRIPPRLTQLGRMRRRLIAELPRRGIDVVDLTPALRAAPSLTYYVRDGHWNEIGHRVAARIVLDAIRRGDAGGTDDARPAGRSRRVVPRGGAAPHTNAFRRAPARHG